MSTFVAVARAGSLSAAARGLGEPLTTVSRRLAALEEHLGASLVTRTTRRLALTEAGRSYLDVCRRVLDELETAESEIAGREGDVAGEIVVTAPVVFGRLNVLPLLVRFLAAHPRLDARLDLTDRIVDLTEDAVDVALRIGALPDSALRATRVGTVRRIVCASPAYLKAHGVPRMPQDLASAACIAFGPFARERAWVFESVPHGRNTVRVRTRLSVTTAEAALEAALAGLGVARVLSYQAAEALARKRLRAVLEAYDDTAIPVHLVHRNVRQQRPQVRLFLDFAAQELRARLASRTKAAGRA